MVNSSEQICEIEAAELQRIILINLINCENEYRPSNAKEEAV